MSDETPRCGLCGRDPSWKGLIDDFRGSYECPACGAGWQNDHDAPDGFPECGTCTAAALASQLDAMHARRSGLQYYVNRLPQGEPLRPIIEKIIRLISDAKSRADDLKEREDVGSHDPHLPKNWERDGETQQRAML